MAFIPKVCVSSAAALSLWDLFSVNANFLRRQLQRCSFKTATSVLKEHLEGTLKKQLVSSSLD